MSREQPEQARVGPPRVPTATRPSAAGASVRRSSRAVRTRRRPGRSPPRSRPRSGGRRARGPIRPRREPRAARVVAPARRAASSGPRVAVGRGPAGRAERAGQTGSRPGRRPAGTRGIARATARSRTPRRIAARSGQPVASAQVASEPGNASAPIASASGGSREPAGRPACPRGHRSRGRSGRPRTARLAASTELHRPGPRISTVFQPSRIDRRIGQVAGWPPSAADPGRGRHVTTGPRAKHQPAQERKRRQPTQPDPSPGFGREVGARVVARAGPPHRTSRSRATDGDPDGDRRQRRRAVRLVEPERGVGQLDGQRPPEPEHRSARRVRPGPG